MVQPDKCESIVVPKDRGPAFVQWVINEEKTFKPEGCWQQHLEVGSEAMDIAQRLGDTQSVMELSIQLASTWFYMGNAEKCKELAHRAIGMAVDYSYRSGEIRGLYLLSAAERAQQDSAAVKTAERALNLSNQYLPDDHGLKAKVLYNLAAAESDVKPANLVASAMHLQQAAILFKQAGKDYDVLRAKIRLARVEYLQGNYQQALKTAETVKSFVKKPREEMIYNYQLAKIYHRLGKWQDALKRVEIAGIKAEKLNATADLERISRLRHAIRNHQFLEE